MIINKINMKINNIDIYILSLFSLIQARLTVYILYYLRSKEVVSSEMMMWWQKNQRVLT